MQVLEALAPGLGWRVFCRYPEVFASPDAVECWRLAAAYLFTLGVAPDQVGERRAWGFVCSAAAWCAVQWVLCGSVCQRRLRV